MAVAKNVMARALRSGNDGKDLTNRLGLLAWAVLILLQPAACTGQNNGQPPSSDDDDSSAAGDDDDSALPAKFSIDVEVTVQGSPVAGAQVLQGGGPLGVVTDAQGRATLSMDATVDGELWVIAALEGHRSAGIEILQRPTGLIQIDLSPVEIDNPDFPYGDPGVKDNSSTAFCSHCHLSIASSFEESKHREAANSPWVHDLFSGTAAALDTEETCTEAGGVMKAGTIPGTGTTGSRCYIGEGLLPASSPDCGGETQLSCDDPELDAAATQPSTGACADCHAPAIEGRSEGGHSLLDATGLAYEEGVHCDFCHKVMDVDLKQAPGLGGRLVLGRPLEDGSPSFALKPATYGPYADVLNIFMGGVYAPIFREASFCAGCHEYDQGALWAGQEPDPNRWPSGTLPIHSTHTEWLASASAPLTTCQTCHMVPLDVANSADIDSMDNLSPGVAAGFLRAKGEVKSHNFRGPLSTGSDGLTMLKGALLLHVTGSNVDDELVVEVTATNYGAGHAIPTGEPLRSVVALIEAKGCDDELLEQSSGPVVSAVGGALARGYFGDQITEGATANSLSWPGLTASGSATDWQVTALRPTGSFEDYEGPAPFNSEGFSVEARGRPLYSIVGRSPANSEEAGTLILAEDLALIDGDLLLLGESGQLPEEGDPPKALAGRTGSDYAKVLVDSEGNFPVPHFQAKDILRDDRILPLNTRTGSYAFPWPEACNSVSAEARLLYRRAPPLLARERGWDSREVVVAIATTNIARGNSR